MVYGVSMRTFIASLVVTVLLNACAAPDPNRLEQRGAGWYTVKRSDTLYSIAWRYGLDSQQLADWNRIDINAPIHPGQRLRLIRPANASESTQTAGASVTGGADEPVVSRVESAPLDGGQPITTNPDDWIWPTVGKPRNTFKSNQLDRRGIRIGGKLGQSVVAVADGKVVYSGNGLAGYGNLIIIKHSETYLSAYAYCQQRLVEEGMSVKAGKQVATMGSKDNVAQLHFEIRRNGKPVDPLKYLPRQ